MVAARFRPIPPTSRHLSWAVAAAYIDPNPLEPDRWPGAQLFPQPESISLEFLGGLRRGLLSGNAGCETDGRLALDGRQEVFRRNSKLDCRCGQGLSRHGNYRSAMEGMDGPVRCQLDAQARLHRSIAVLWLLFARLQGRRRQSAGRRSAACFGPVMFHIRPAIRHIR